MKRTLLKLTALLTFLPLLSCSAPTPAPSQTDGETVDPPTAGVSESQTPTPAPDPNVITVGGKAYRLTMSDDFDGTDLNPKIWSHCPEWERGNYGGKWSNDCARLDGEGHLILDAKLGADGKPLSGAIRSAGRFEQTMGYFEARCKLQQTTGFWSAFWLMSGTQSAVGNGAVDGAEIDVFEAINPSGKKINHAVHWDGYAEHHDAVGMTVTRDVYDGDYHTFGVLWDEDGYTFYIDGRRTYSLDASNPKYPGASEAPCYLKLTIEFGDWAGAIKEDELPSGLIVDWVKVYALDPEANVPAPDTDTGDTLTPSEPMLLTEIPCEAWGLCGNDEPFYHEIPHSGEIFEVNGVHYQNGIFINPFDASNPGFAEWCIKDYAFDTLTFDFGKLDVVHGSGAPTYVKVWADDTLIGQCTPISQGEKAVTVTCSIPKGTEYLRIECYVDGASHNSCSSVIGNPVLSCLSHKS